MFLWVFAVASAVSSIGLGMHGTEFLSGKLLIEVDIKHLT